jgi:hypothetical protein
MEMGMAIREMNKHSFLTLEAWIHKHLTSILMLLSLAVIVFLVYFFGWWETIGILFLKFGLGAKVAGAKTFTHAIIKAGGKKAIVLATAGMLTKRHIIDLISKFFTKHSIDRYKKNLIIVIKLKIMEIKESSIAKKLKAIGSTLLSIPIVYFFWTKVLGTAIQKFIYALVVPLISAIWSVLTVSLNFLSFIFQVLMLNVFIETLAKYKVGKVIIYIIDKAVVLTAKVLNIFNSLLSIVGINPKIWLIKLSNMFNRWLESIIDKGLNYTSKLYNRRKRYVNAVESVSEKRYIFKEQKKDKKSSNWVQIQQLYKRVILKEKLWRDNRAKRLKRWEGKNISKSHNIREKVKLKRAKGEALTLPYHISQKIKRRK